MSAHDPDSTDSGESAPGESPQEARSGSAGRVRFAPGTVIDGRFEVEAALGHGGMGYVLSARHLELDERVAIKLLLPGKADGAARQRMLREARHAAKIKSEHSVRVFDIVNTGPAAPYMVMELLRGESLAERLARGGPLSVAEVVGIVLESCEAVGEAHQLGIVHRDLKPSNLFLVGRPDGNAFVKVLDFGVSKRLDADADHELTQSRALLGSPVYAPPEQLRASRTVDRRADIWSLGTILYQGLTRALPFRGDTLAEICTRILQDPPPPPRSLRPDIPAALEAVILKCLEKQPARRMSRVEELVLALREWSPGIATKTLIYLDALRAADDPESAEPSGGALDAGAPLETDRFDPENAPTLSAATLGDRRDTTPPKRRTRAAVALPLLAALALSLFWFARGPSSHPAAAPAANALAKPPLAASSAAPNATPVPSETGGVAATAPAASALPAPRPARRRAHDVSTGAKRASPSPVEIGAHPWVDSR